MSKVLFTSNVDGFNKFYYYYYEKLQNSGWTIDVASRGTANIPNINRKYNVAFGRNPFVLSNVKAFFQLVGILKKGNYDIVFCNTPIPGFITRLAIMFLHIETKVLYSAHGFSFGKYTTSIKEKIFFALEKSLSSFTDVIITMNKEDFEISSENFDCKTVYVDGVGVDKGIIGSISVEAQQQKRRQLGLNATDFVAVYPAELTDRKNQMLGFKIIEKLNNKRIPIVYLLCGKGKNFDIYQDYIKKHNLPVRIMGFREDVLEILDISDILIATSKFEGLPINVIEAMSKGIPIVATSCKGHTDLIVEEENGYIFDEDYIEKAVEDISFLYNNPSERERVRNNNILKSEKYFVDRVFLQYKKIFEDVLNG